MLTKLEISSEELARLNYERYHYPCPLVQKRLHSIYIKAMSALSNDDVSRHCWCSSPTASYSSSFAGKEHLAEMNKITRLSFILHTVHSPKNYHYE